MASRYTYLAVGHVELHTSMTSESDFSIKIIFCPGVKIPWLNTKVKNRFKKVGKG